MGMQEAVKLYFKNYFKFDGRSRRAEYWWPYLAVFLIAIALNILAGIFAAMGDAGGLLAGLVMLVYAVFVLAILIPNLAVTFRRLHDTNHSAWWLLLCVTGIGSIVILVFLILEGTNGSNKYGDDPKGFSSVETF